MTPSAALRRRIVRLGPYLRLRDLVLRAQRDTFLELLRAVPLPCRLVEARLCPIDFAVVLRRDATGV